MATLGADGDPVNVNSESSIEHRGPSAAVLLAAAAIVWLAAVIAIRPLDAFPLFDDWVYSWSAFRLAGGEGMVVPEWSSVYPLAQAAWGAAFVALLGAEDWVLRLSTVVLAAIGHLCWYRLLRGCGIASRWALVAVAGAVFHPIYFLLTLSFMTDVPMVALWQIGLYAAWRWLDCDSSRWQWVAIAAGLAAAYARQTGAALLVGLLVVALVRRRRGRSFAEPLGPFIAICVVVAGVFVFGADVGEELPMTARLADLLMVVRVSPWVYVDGVTIAAAFVGLSVAPFAGLHLSPSNWRWFAAAALVLAGVWMVGDAPLLRSGTMWGACELGGASSLLTSRPVGCAWQSPARVLALAASALGWSALGPVLAGHLKQARTDLAGGGAVREFRLLAVVTFSVFGLGLIALWLFADRYWLAPAVLAPALLLAMPPSSPRWTTTALAAYALIAVVGTAAVFGFYRQVDDARSRLLEQGVAGSDIDAGYAHNGRYRYLALPAAPSGQGRNYDLPWVTGIAASTWTIANGADGPTVITATD